VVFEMAGKGHAFFLLIRRLRMFVLGSVLRRYNTLEKNFNLLRELRGPIYTFRNHLTWPSVQRTLVKCPTIVGQTSQDIRR